MSQYPLVIATPRIYRGEKIPSLYLKYVLHLSTINLRLLQDPSIIHDYLKKEYGNVQLLNIFLGSLMNGDSYIFFLLLKQKVMSSATAVKLMNQVRFPVSILK